MGQAHGSQAVAHGTHASLVEGSAYGSPLRCDNELPQDGHRCLCTH